METRTATVTVQYVNDPKPGKKMGSIKTAEMGYFGVYPDKLKLFEQGKTYSVEYKTDGDFKRFEKLTELEAQQPPVANGHDKDLHIFVAGVVNNAISSGAIVKTLNEAGSIEEAIFLWGASARKAYFRMAKVTLDKEPPF